MFLITRGTANLVLFASFCTILWLAREGTADCNVCQSNGAACINSTSYYMCFGGITPNQEQLYHCLDGFECTDLRAICVQKNAQRPPSCGNTALCGQCSAHRNYLFACLSRGIFQMCYGSSQPAGKFGYCPTGFVCHAGSDAVCVPENTVSTITCDVADEQVDTTTVQTTDSTTGSTMDSSSDSTPSSTETSTPTIRWTPLRVCEERRESGLFPTVPEDVYCQRYIYCFYKLAVIKAIEYTCPANTYFQIEKQLCTTIKPSYCL
ncbi:uncharacterized protein LOC115623039 [Scaptodrosophila lebanonensis]|uniref:Uncharacterized protein LOC115623039 n=1 Tax=Drosophila lebanonensis TaxID=7225 RepID=A0A6J2T812_DROLE|nr:uncharacterized protein LOC115623039 [Scaptodrosophila lebanonensis]